MSKTNVDLQIQGPRAAITFSADNGVSVLATDVMERFRDLLAEVSKSEQVRTTVVRAQGKVFIAGANIKAMVDFNPDQAREYGKLGQDVLDQLASLPSVTVAAINGAALGGGLEVALACDFRIAVKDAKLGLPEVTLGLIPGWGGVPRLTRLVGPAAAKRLILSGSVVSGEEALALGLIDEAVDSVEQLSERVDGLCKSFLRASPAAVALAKRAMSDGDSLSAFVDCFRNEQSREGMGAFLQKRSARWMEKDES